MKSNWDIDWVFDFLISQNYFTEAELTLITYAIGYNMDTINLICQVRYAMDFDQLFDDYEEFGQYE